MGPRLGRGGGPAELEGRIEQLRRFPRVVKGCRGPGLLRELPDASLGRVDGGGGAWGRGRQARQRYPSCQAPARALGLPQKGARNTPRPGRQREF